MGHWKRVNGKMTEISEGGPGSGPQKGGGSESKKEIKNAKQAKSGDYVVVGGAVGAQSIGVINKISGDNIEILHSDGSKSVVNLKQDGKLSLNKISKQDYRSTFKSMRKGEL